MRGIVGPLPSAAAEPIFSDTEAYGCCCFGFGRRFDHLCILKLLLLRAAAG
jgi:hypothetical protein